MKITIHKDDGAGWAVQPEARRYGLATMRSETRDALLAVADKHTLTYLERLQKRTEEHGPDGVIIHDDFDACVLGVLIDVLHEAEELP